MHVAGVICRLVFKKNLPRTLDPRQKLLHNLPNFKKYYSSPMSSWTGKIPMQPRNSGYITMATGRVGSVDRKMARVELIINQNYHGLLVAGHWLPMIMVVVAGS
jgi:hypothetical protein